MTRDSIFLTLGTVGAILTELANLGNVFPATWQPYIHAATIIIAAVTGKLATSPLPGATPSGK